MNCASYRSSLNSVCAIASISAVSVFGRIGTHWAPMDRGASDSSGLTDTNSMPASLARASHVSSECTPAPPDVTWPFLVASPPNAMISRVCLTIDDQSVTWPVTGWKVPITRGSTYIAAPKL